MTLQDLEKMKPVKSEKDYWEKHKIFKKEIGGFTKTIKKMSSDPKKYLNDFERTLKEGVRINLITQDYADEKIKQLSKELNSPSEFKRCIKKKLKKKFKKR